LLGAEIEEHLLLRYAKKGSVSNIKSVSFDFSMGDFGEEKSIKICKMQKFFKK